MNETQIARYLSRIGYSGPTSATLQTLAALQLAHLYSVPFENLSIHNDEPIVLDKASLYEKIVPRRRGGFCYELNSTFGELLRALGFRVDFLAAEVMNAAGVFGLPFDHLMLRVWLDEPWLVDVGFGDSFRQPLRLNARDVQQANARDYRIDALDDQQVLMERKPNEAWKSQYRFGLAVHPLEAYAAMCHYHQTSAESPFTQKRICTLATKTGRITLTDTAFITTSLTGDRHEQPVTDQDSRTVILRDQFGILL